MLLRLSKNRAQSTAEYAILIAIVIGAAVAMQVYVKRGLQGRVHEVVRSVGDATLTDGTDTVVNPLTGNQYEPYYNRSALTSTRDTTMTDSMAAGGAAAKAVGSDISTRTGTQDVLGTAGAD